MGDYRWLMPLANQARQHATIDVAPIAGTLGAEIRGIRLADCSDEQLSELRLAILDHLAVMVLDQHLDPADQVRFSHRLGPYSPVPFVNPIDGHPEVIAVVKEPDDADWFNFGGVWHTDFTFLPAPPAFTILAAQELPSFGGDTAYANLALAWDALPHGKKAELADVVAIHTARDAYGPSLQTVHDQLRSMDIVTDSSADAEQDHPLVCSHPETGRTILYFNPTYVRGFRGMDAEASRQLHDFLDRWCTHIRFTARLRWQPGAVAIWDNRATMHFAMNDYSGARRALHRTTVAGSVPVKAGW